MQILIFSILTLHSIAIIIAYLQIENLRKDQLRAWQLQIELNELANKGK